MKLLLLCAALLRTTTAANDFCSSGLFYVDPSYACDSTTQSFGPPTWRKQNRGSSLFDRCRGMDGANADFVSPETGLHICKLSITRTSTHRL